MLPQAVWSLAILLSASWLSPVGAGQQIKPDANRTLSPEVLRPSAGVVTRWGRIRYLNIGKLFCVAFSADGTILAAAGWDGSIRLWDVRRGLELRQCSGHTGATQALAFAPDGRTLLAGGRDAAIHIWDTATGRELRRLAGHTSAVLALSMTADGRVLASRSADGTVLLWDQASGRKLGGPPVQRGSFRALAFSPDGSLLAYASDFRTISLWDLAAGRVVRQFQTPMFSGFHALTFSSDGKTLAGVSWGGIIHLWDLRSGKEQRPLARIEPDVKDLAFSPDGRTLAGAGGDGVIHVWEMTTRQERCQFRPPEGNLLSLAFSPNGRILALGANDTTVLIWDLLGPTNGNIKPEQLSAVWTDLGSADAARAYRAVCTMVAAPRQSLPFLKEHLRPAVCPLAADGIDRLVADLDNSRYLQRKRAFEDLEKLGEFAESALRKSLGHQLTLEMRQRVEQLLAKIEQERENPTAQTLQGLRALEVLEDFSTIETVSLLKVIAGGAADARLTQGARTALQRMAAQVNR